MNPFRVSLKRPRSSSPKKKKKAKGTIYDLSRTTIFENCVFHKDGPPRKLKTIKDPVQYYECSKRKSHDCRVRLKEVLGKISYTDPEIKHKHKVDRQEIEDRRFKEYLHSKTKNAFAAPRQIYDEAAAKPE